jgi:hypothetical protein
MPAGIDRVAIPEVHSHLLLDHGRLSVGMDSSGGILDDLLTIAPRMY